MKKIIIKIVYTLIKIFPHSFQEKIKIIGCVLVNPWGFYYYDGHTLPQLQGITADTVENMLKGMSDCSIATAKRFMECLPLRAKYSLPSHDIEHFFIYNEKINMIPVEKYTLEELEQKQKDEFEMLQMIRNNCCKKYFNLKTTGPESWVYHHGLRDLPKSVKKYIQGKCFIDGGAYFGDSALIFQQYNPGIILSFEISKKNAAIYKEVMEKNKISNTRYQIIMKGLGKKEDTLLFNDTGKGDTSLSVKGNSSIRMVSLDHFINDYDSQVGFIKYDLEGGAFDAILGSIKTIQKDRPVLSIAIYHTKDEFLKIYPFLKNELKNYYFEIKWFHIGYDNELCLIGYPNELQ